MRYPETIEIEPGEPVRGRLRPPGSKSLTNRALITAALARGTSTLRGALASDDTQVMIDGLHKLGIEVRQDPAAQRLTVGGCSGRIPAAQADLFVGNSGTSMRFLTALVSLGNGTYRLDGVPRMRERPIGDLLDALDALGVDARSEPGTGCPPVVVHARGLGGGNVTIRGDMSSQFLSGLLMAAPYASDEVVIELDGRLVSQPYVAMTLAVMAQFGCEVENDRFHRFSVPAPRCYVARDYQVEPDASAASYFFAAAAITGGRVSVEGLDRSSVQGDLGLLDLLEQMGCRVAAAGSGRESAECETVAPAITLTGGPLRGIQADMNAISDTVQTLAAVALFADGPTSIRHVAHIRHKETDRIAALATELRKLGATVDERPDGLEIHPAPLHGATIETYDDHRMAMSLALVGLRIPDVVITNPGCVAKTYPGFFEDLARLGVSFRT